ncbi:hypothetical protein CVT24_009610 [Panaeolus cyanescens]|uniref:Uncharacterized protein n=1 Tax=Panaeolus cyanescens TaxID=181874 RepID=A0A409YA35_9AGAR|nr:hypothetical protein CVT24_009610 [Panaeolus cyanescens]
MENSRIRNSSGSSTSYSQPYVPLSSALQPVHSQSSLSCTTITRTPAPVQSSRTQFGDITNQIQGQDGFTVLPQQKTLQMTTFSDPIILHQALMASGFKLPDPPIYDDEFGSLVDSKAPHKKLEKPSNASTVFLHTFNNALLREFTFKCGDTEVTSLHRDVVSKTASVYWQSMDRNQRLFWDISAVILRNIHFLAASNYQYTPQSPVQAAPIVQPLAPQARATPQLRVAPQAPATPQVKTPRKAKRARMAEKKIPLVAARAIRPPGQKKRRPSTSAASKPSSYKKSPLNTVMTAMTEPEFAPVTQQQMALASGIHNQEIGQDWTNQSTTGHANLPSASFDFRVTTASATPNSGASAYTTHLASSDGTTNWSYGGAESSVPHSTPDMLSQPAIRQDAVDVSTYQDSTNWGPYIPHMPSPNTGHPGPSSEFSLIAPTPSVQPLAGGSSSTSNLDVNAYSYLDPPPTDDPAAFERWLRAYQKD